MVAGGGSYLSAKKQSVHFTAPADWAIKASCNNTFQTSNVLNTTGNYLIKEKLHRSFLFQKWKSEHQLNLWFHASKMEKLKVHMLYTHLPYHNDSIIVKIDAGRRMKTSLQTYLPLTLLQGFERVVQGLHVRGCWRPNINFIFWPHCYDRHVVSFLFSWCWGPLHRGFSEGPLSRVWLSLPHLVSNSLEVC